MLADGVCVVRWKYGWIVVAVAHSSVCSWVGMSSSGLDRVMSNTFHSIRCIQVAVGLCGLGCLCSAASVGSGEADREIEFSASPALARTLHESVYGR